MQLLELADDPRRRDRTRPGEHLQKSIHRLGDGEHPSRGPPRGIRERTAPNRPPKAPGERLGVVGSDQHHAPAVRLGQTSVVRRDDPAARVLRLEGDDAERLVPVLAVGRHHHDILRRHQRGHRLRSRTARHDRDPGVDVEHLLDDPTLRLVRSCGRRREEELDVVVDDVDVEHRQEGVDPLLGTEPAGEEDTSLAGHVLRARFVGEARLRERVDDADRPRVHIQETGPQRGGVAAGGDEGEVACSLDGESSLVLSKRRRVVQDQERRFAGAHDVRLVDEDDRPREVPDVGERRQRHEGEVGESVPPVVLPEADRDDLGRHTAAVQLPHLTDGVVLGATGACRQAVSWGPDERDHAYHPCVIDELSRVADERTAAASRNPTPHGRREHHADDPRPGSRRGRSSAKQTNRQHPVVGACRYLGH